MAHWLSFFGSYKVHVADTNGLRQLIQRYDCGVSLPTLKAAEVLLAEPGPRLHVLLGEALGSAQARKVPTDELAHIHALALLGSLLIISLPARAEITLTFHPDSPLGSVFKIMSCVSSGHNATPRRRA